jgi:hypothetical protein
MDDDHPESQPATVRCIYVFDPEGARWLAEVENQPSTSEASSGGSGEETSKDSSG